MLVYEISDFQHALSFIFLFLETHEEEKYTEDISAPAWPIDKTADPCEEVEDEEAMPYIEQFEKAVQDEMIHLGSLPLEQVRVKNQKTAPLFAS